MLAGLEKKSRASRRKRSGKNQLVTACLKAPKEPAGGKTTKDWSLYILRCSDSTFYTGITNDLARRLKMHQDGKASRYTRTRGPVEMLYSEICGDRSSALIRECEVKEWPRVKKEALISGEKKSKTKSVRGTAKNSSRRKRRSVRRTNISPADRSASASKHRSASKDNPEQGPLPPAGSWPNSENRSAAAGSNPASAL